MSWVPTVSPTQIDDWNLCERKWGFRTLVKGAYVQNIGAFRGDYGHKMLEAWGRDRTPPENLADDFALQVALQFPKDLDEKHISAADYATRLVGTVNRMLPSYPEPPWPSIERDFRVTIQGVVWAGRKDLETPDTVWDHKFSSSIDYVKTAEQLPHDAQALSYAFEKFYRQALSQVTVKLSYGIVGKTPRALIREHTFTPEEAAQNIAPHTLTGQRLTQLRLRRPDPLSLTPNWLACPHFGGCSFQDKCKPTPEQLIEAHAAMATGEPPMKPKTGDTKMEGGLLSQLAGIPAAGTSQAPALATTGAAVATEARSDMAQIVADCQRDAANLLRLGIARPEVVKAMAARYVGIAMIVDSLVPTEAARTAADVAAGQAVAQAAQQSPAVNSGPPLGIEAKVETKAEDKPKASESAHKAARAKATEAKGYSQAVGTTAAIEAFDGMLRGLATEVSDRNSGSLGERATAALSLVEAFKKLTVPA